MWHLTQLEQHIDMALHIQRYVKFVQKKTYIYSFLCWRTPKILDGLNCESKGDNNEMRRSWCMFPGLQHFKGKGVC
jgi:hypothetical protein